MKTENFAYRHIGPRVDDVEDMLQTIKANSLDELCEETIPASIRLQGQMNLPDAMSEANCIQHIAALGSKNKVHKSIPYQKRVQNSDSPQKKARTQPSLTSKACKFDSPGFTPARCEFRFPENTQNTTQTRTNTAKKPKTTENQLCSEKRNSTRLGVTLG